MDHFAYAFDDVEGTAVVPYTVLDGTDSEDERMALGVISRDRLAKEYPDLNEDLLQKTAPRKGYGGEWGLQAYKMVSDGLKLGVEPDDAKTLNYSRAQLVPSVY